MKAIVVYESLWGNTAAIARAIAEGIGPEARALSTAEATAAVTADADLIVAGAPLHAFRLPTDKIRNTLATKKDEKAPTPPNLSHPSMRTWLVSLSKGKGKATSFETRFKWSPGGAAGAIAREEIPPAPAGPVPIQQQHPAAPPGDHLKRVSKAAAFPFPLGREANHVRMDG